ncbi:MAG: ABC transporter permease [Marinifilaceae bacterium]
MNKLAVCLAFRNLLREKYFTLINIIGLTVGFVAVFLILLYYAYENSYDQSAAGSESVFRLKYAQFQNSKLVFDKATSVYAIGPLLKESLPEVLQYGRGGYETCLVYRNDVMYNDVKLMWVDSTFLETIALNLDRGNAKRALVEPYTTVLSSSLAKEYFGDQDPIGQIIYINKKMPFRVTGIFKDLPSNTHFNFRLLISLSTLDHTLGEYGTKDRSWGGESWLYTYLKLKPNSDLPLLDRKIEKVVNQHLPEKYTTDNIAMKFGLQCIRDIHLLPQLDNEFKPKGNAQNLKFMLIISVLLIVITWINYINISISRFFEKEKSLTIRKVLGATKFSLIIDYTLEALLLNCIAGLMAFCISFFMGGWFDSISGKPLSNFLAENSLLYIYFPALVFIISLLAGVYFMFSILSIWSGNKSIIGGKGGTIGSLVKRGLIVFQLMASTCLIASVFIIGKQMNFIQSKEKGFDEKQVMVLEAPKTLNMDSTKLKRYLLFREQLLLNSNVKAVTSSLVGIGDEVLDEERVTHMNGSPVQNVSVKSNCIDDGYLKVHDVKLLAGCNFSPDIDGNRDKILVNEAAVQMLGIESSESIINSTIRLAGGEPLTVIGLVQNFHQESLHQPVKPTIFYHYHPTWFGSYSVKITDHGIPQTIRQIEKIWKQFYPNAPFDYHFLDEYFDELYHSDRRFGHIMFLFAFLSLFVSCLGLVGLILIVSGQKKKEIGIRKVNGASLMNILVLLTKDIMIWVGVAVVVISPVTWLIMEKWLAGFAFHISIDVGIFILTGLVVLFISMLTVIWQCYYAAVKNPIEALKCE